MSEKKEVKTNKSRLVGRYGSRQPDRNWDDETGYEDLAGFAADELEKFEQDNKRLADLYAKDVRFAGLMNHAANGGDILDYLLDAYGSDFADALNGDEGRRKLSERKKKEDESRDRKKKDDEEYDGNTSQSEKDFEAIKEKYKMSDEDLAEIYHGMRQISRDVAFNKFTPDAMERYIKGGRYDKDVAGAREEGHIAGKNQRARTELRESAKKPGDIPHLEGSGGVTREVKPRAKKATGMFGVEITSSSSSDGASSSSGASGGGE